MPVGWLPTVPSYWPPSFRLASMAPASGLVPMKPDSWTILVLDQPQWPRYQAHPRSPPSTWLAMADPGSRPITEDLSTYFNEPRLQVYPQRPKHQVCLPKVSNNKLPMDTTSQSSYKLWIGWLVKGFACQSHIIKIVMVFISSNMQAPMQRPTHHEWSRKYDTTTGN